MIHQPAADQLDGGQDNDGVFIGDEVTANDDDEVTANDVTLRLNPRRIQTLRGSTRPRVGATCGDVRPSSVATSAAFCGAPPRPAIALR